MSLFRQSLARSVTATRPARQLAVRGKAMNQPNADSNLEAKRENKDQAESGTMDAISATSGKSSPQAQEMGKQSSTPKSGFQPGQKGEQVSGQEGGINQSVNGSEEAASPSMFQTLKSAVGIGNADHRQSKTERREFSTSARALAASGGDKTEGSQNEHIVHHEAGKEDKMPAVRNDAELPSHKDTNASQGVHEPDQPKPSNSKAAAHPAAGSSQPGYGSGPGTAGKDSQRGFSTSAFRLAEPTTQGLHNNSPAAYNSPPNMSSSTATIENSSPRAVRRYVRGTPEPSSYKLGYHIIDYQTPEAYQAPMPSSSQVSSSTSNEPANPNTIHEDPPSAFRSIPPDFDTEVRGKWAHPLEGGNEIPPEGDKITGGTLGLREGAPRPGEKTMEGEQAPTAATSDADPATRKQAAELKGADPESSSASIKTHKIAKPAFPDDVAPKGEESTTLEEVKKTKKRSGPTKKQQS